LFNTSKICDASDWFDPEFKLVLQNEIREPAKFHRKQWEFGMIFLTLKKFGFLSENKKGLSLGSGNERILYSIANHVNKLVITDLYDKNTEWDCARTGDPDYLIKSNKPFPVDNNKLQAIRMDMRSLEFDNDTFDFCYSSCAIEHIGGYDDFLKHLNEVYRVLKEDGIYVLTTELLFGEKTIEDPHNFYFVKEYLDKLINESKLHLLCDIDCSLSQHSGNLPFPSNFRDLANSSQQGLIKELFDFIPHIILLKGKKPFTSVLIILQKKHGLKKTDITRFNNFEITKQYLLDGVDKYRKIISENELSLSPFSRLPNEVSCFFIDHSEFFEKRKTILPDDTVFHTDYFWFGEGRRNFNIELIFEDALSDMPAILQIRVHKYLTEESTDIRCIYERNINVFNTHIIKEKILLETDEDSQYAVLCKIISGNVSCKSISIKCNMAEKVIHNNDYIDNFTKDSGVIY